MTRSRQHGFALLLVLWTMVLLALVITRLSTAGRTELRIAANLRANAEAKAAADGAVSEAIFRLNDASALHWDADDSEHRLDRAGVRLDIHLESMTGKVNPNIAPIELLTKLLRLAGSGLPPVEAGNPDAIAAAIVTWRSSPGPQRDALLASYRAAGLDHGPPGAPFETLQELGRVMGMTPALLKDLLPHLSLYPLGPPDARKADPVVAAALQNSTPGAGTQMPLDPTGLTKLPIIEVDASAVTTSGARFVRRAVVRLNPALPRGGTFLAWSTDEANID
ncbi:MAG TPA: type II secretion system protein GspK [Aliidongia sp.]|nr:type II secretion system protein GspK [Aliidongia sp.]